MRHLNAIQYDAFVAALRGDEYDKTIFERPNQSLRGGSGIKPNDAPKVDILILDRFGRVLVEIKDGFDFELRSTDLTNAITFDHAGVADVLSRLEHLAASHGPFSSSTVRDFKMKILDSFGSQEAADQTPNMAPRM